MTAPSKKILYQNRNKTQAIQKANRETNLLLLLAAISAQRPDDLLQNYPKAKEKLI